MSGTELLQCARHLGYLSGAFFHAILDLRSGCATAASAVAAVFGNAFPQVIETVEGKVLEPA